MQPYPHLFSPLEIGNVVARNRVMQTGHGKNWSRRGMDTQRDLDYVVERAKGGLGLQITGSRPGHPTGTSPRVAPGFNRESVAVDRRLTEAVHEHGALIFSQVSHVGLLMQSSDANDDLRVLWSPSALRAGSAGETAKAMDATDIHELVEGFALSAEYIREGGFDGVELHFAHTYLIHQFLSPLFNRRTDEYGGSAENRARLPLEIIARVRARVGDDFVVGVRLGLTDFGDGAYGVEDAIISSRLLTAGGQLDYVSASAAGLNKGFEISASDVPDGHMIGLAAQLKATLSVPVFVIGGIKDPARAEAIIATGQGDMVAMTRTQIADPHFVAKVREGREDEIYHCIRGNQGCISRLFRGLGMACTVNPVTGREGRFGGSLPPASPPARWLVVGAGPAGMKAAETLAKRGHEVTLVEREERLGGQLNLILRTPGRQSFAWVTRDLEAHMRKNGVDIRLGVTATAGTLAELAPDGVIVATGALPTNTGFSLAAPFVDRIPGVEQAHVLTAWDVLLGTKPIGERVVVLDDEGGRFASGTAEVALEQARSAVLVTRFGALLPGLTTTLDSAFVNQRLYAAGLDVRIHSWISSIEADEIVVYNLYSGREERIACDTVVLATPPSADDALYRELSGLHPNVHPIGDCVAPRKLDHAIYEGYVAGRELFTTEERYIREGELETWQEPVEAGSSA